MNKEILIQYAEMKEEVKDLRRRIEREERIMKKMQDDGCQVSDTVSGTRRDGTIGPIKITGFPLPEYERRNSVARKRTERLRVLESDLLDALNEVDSFVMSIPKSDIRMIFRLYYIDDMSWVGVAREMNRRFPRRTYTADSCRMRHNRYLQKK